MPRFSPLLAITLILVTLLGHHVHGGASSVDTPTVSSLSATTSTTDHAHSGVKGLQVVQHGSLEEIIPELCTIGGQASTSPSSGPGHISFVLHEHRAEMADAVPATAPTWDEPAFPADVARAFLQVFLN